MSKQFLVSANGTQFGVFEAADEQAARDACAVQAGYESEADMESQLEQASDLVAEEIESIASVYIGGRITSTPEDQFYADGIEAEAIADDGEYTTFEFSDGSRCRINADGEVFADEMTGPFEIAGRYSHLNDTEAGREALDEYERAIEAGKDHDEAEVIASNVLQRAGYGVNKTGGVSIQRGKA